MLFRRLTREFASAKTNAIEKYGEDLEKNEGEWTGEAEIRTRKNLWHSLSIFGYILTYSVLLRENFRHLWGFNRGDLNISASAVPNNKDTFKTKRNGKLQHIKLFKQYMEMAFFVIINELLRDKVIAIWNSI